MSNVRILDSPESVAQAAASLIHKELANGARTLVLAGGATPGRTYQLLQPGSTWGRVTILFGDERCVPPDDPESNYAMASRELLQRIPPATVHRMPGELGPDEAAKFYEGIVERYHPLDLVLLGTGTDGHTASLFPGGKELNASGLVTGVCRAPKPPPQRVTLTLGALRAARRVLLLIAGARKAQAMVRAMREEVPAGMIPGAEYLVDREAAALL
jgi:6-phosphogluconolactonase